MHLLELHLQQFRQYDDVKFTLSPQLNLIFGPNAAGKTTILEAISTCMLGRSFRTSRYTDLIQKKASSFRIESLFVKHGVVQTLQATGSAKSRRFIHNSTLLNKIIDLFGLLHGIIVTPDDVQLIKGAPAQRRQFLDLQLAQLDPLYIHHLMRYMRAMRQRNQLLRTQAFATLDSWEYEMAQSAVYVVSQRQKAIQALEKYANHFYAELSGEVNHLTCTYRVGGLTSPSRSDMQAQYIQQWGQHRAREAVIGQTLCGPHRDDCTIGLSAGEARHFASEGEQRTCILALHLAAWKRLQECGGETPLFLVDDASIGLDPARRNRLLAQFAQLGQVFVTTTDRSLLEGYNGPHTTIDLGSVCTSLK